VGIVGKGVQVDGITVGEEVSVNVGCSVGFLVFAAVLAMAVEIDGAESVIEAPCGSSVSISKDADGKQAVKNTANITRVRLYTFLIFIFLF